MLISKIGEFGLIRHIRKQIKTDASVIKGSGDDCAVLEFDRSRYQLFTCDMIVEGVDFKENDKLNLVGRKALAVSLSDIAACAGIPRYALVSVGLPANMTVREIDEIMYGMLQLAKEYNVNIVGGDISCTRKLIIDISMLGIVEKKNLVLRNGAKIGDLVFVSGELGGSILGKHFRFIPRLREARFLVENFKINAMIDISDGLVQDLGHILEQSRVGAIIYERLIPINKQAKNLKEALYMGEDFELLFTLSHDEAKKLIKVAGHKFKLIGEIVNKKYGLRLIDSKNRERLLKIKGFSHF